LGIGGEKGAALLDFTVSNGISAGLGALATPVSGARASSLLRLELNIRFMVEAPGPNETPVAANLVSRFEFGTVINDVSGFGDALNNVGGLSGTTGVRIVDALVPSFVVMPGLIPFGQTPATGSLNEIVSPAFELLTNRQYELDIQLLAQSRASGGNVSVNGETVLSSGAASQSFEWTFGLLLPAGAAVHFLYEDALGFPAPELGKVAPIGIPPTVFLLGPPLLGLLRWQRRPSTAQRRIAP